MLSSSEQVVWALITYTDWWQPTTSSVYRVGNRRGTFASDGIRAGLLDTLVVRDELCRRMQTGGRDVTDASCTCGTSVSFRPTRSHGS